MYRVKYLPGLDSTLICFEQHPASLLAEDLIKIWAPMTIVFFPLYLGDYVKEFSALSNYALGELFLDLASLVRISKDAEKFVSYSSWIFEFIINRSKQSTTCSKRLFSLSLSFELYPVEVLSSSVSGDFSSSKQETFTTADYALVILSSSEGTLTESLSSFYSCICTLYSFLQNKDYFPVQAGDIGLFKFFISTPTEVFLSTLVKLFFPTGTRISSKVGRVLFEGDNSCRGKIIEFWAKFIVINFDYQSLYPIFQ